MLAHLAVATPAHVRATPDATLPVLLVIADTSDAECVAVGSDTCLRMVVQLPDFDDPQGQCSPDSDNARALPKLLQAAIKGQVFKKAGNLTGRHAAAINRQT